MVRISTQRDQGDETRIELTPLVDVVFLLLIFFLLTATSAQHVFDITLPAAKGSLVHRDEQRVNIDITERGSILINGVVSTIDNVNEIPETSAVVIYGDEGAPYGIFVQVIDTLRINGIEGITIATMKKP
ncbi:MAG: ExbD/TolR family protein [Desulfomonilia bacterium]